MGNGGGEKEKWKGWAGEGDCVEGGGCRKGKEDG